MNARIVFPQTVCVLSHYHVFSSFSLIVVQHESKDPVSSPACELTRFPALFVGEVVSFSMYGLDAFVQI